MISMNAPESLTTEDRRLEIANFLAHGVLCRIWEYKGRPHRVVHIEERSGFEYKRDRYRTLTDVAIRLSPSRKNKCLRN